MEELEELDAHIGILKEGLRAKQPPLKDNFIIVIIAIIAITIVIIVIVIIILINVI